MGKRERYTEHKTGGTKMHLVVLALAACLLPISIGLAAIRHEDAKSTLEHSLRREADRDADLISAYFERASSVVLLLANNPSFREFYEAPGSLEHKIRQQGPQIHTANEALAYVETLYPNSIGEACLIDVSGQEIARVVRGEIARPDDLSPDEDSNPFFDPTMSTPPGGVHQALPYVSPDTGEWVIANATKLPTTDGPSPGLVHFEVTIESFRLAFSGGDDLIQVVDRATGAIIIDSEHPQRMDAPLGPNNPGRGNPYADGGFDDLVAPGESEGVGEIDGRPVAFRQVSRLPGNANDWVAVAASQEPFGALGGVGAASVAFIVFSIMLLLVAAFNVLVSQRNLIAATTDSLTGLANRRLLMSDLSEAASKDDQTVLIFSDLDGFKNYNDSFGHPAGDSLLSRLAGRLGAAVGKQGRAYRVGGDEFCVLASVRDSEECGLIVSRVTEAMSEDGQGFSIGCSAGWVLVPMETSDPEEALRLADQRMYVEKQSGRTSAESQTRDVLLSVLCERSQGLGEHIASVSELAERVSRAMGLEDEKLEHVRRAADLHDVGKIAIPDSILFKPGPLDDSEWEYMHRHTIIGERILLSAPSLEPVAKLVRSSHERVDGTGYPDNLSGEDIPLGARIIAVCDAFDAMVGDRPYREPMSPEQAMEELKRCAGSQFDRSVVDVFEKVIATVPTVALGRRNRLSKNGARDGAVVGGGEYSVPAP